VGVEASTLARSVRLRATVEKAKGHAAAAHRNYRAACLVAWESGNNVTVLARTHKTSWARMSDILKQAKAERGR
jgi:hypothetical protein